MTGARTLIRNGIILPISAAHPRSILDPGSVLLEGLDIADVGPVEVLDRDPRSQGRDDRRRDGACRAARPAQLSLALRTVARYRRIAIPLGLAADLRRPGARGAYSRIAEAASWQCYAESLRAGTTSVMELWRFMEHSASVADVVGLRATLVPYVADAPGYAYFETSASNRRLLETRREAADGRVRGWVGLEHLFDCTPEAFRVARNLADEFDTGLHLHSLETRWEVDESLRRYGRRPIEELFRRGALGERTVVAHGVWLDDHEIQLLADAGTSVAHCP